MRKPFIRGFLILIGLAGFVYLSDDLWARYRGRPTQQLRVDRYYTALDRYNNVEHSIGTPIVQTCIDAMLPHFDYVPCWYLRRHTMQEVRTY